MIRYMLSNVLFFAVDADAMISFEWRRITVSFILHEIRPQNRPTSTSTEARDYMITQIITRLNSWMVRELNLYLRQFIVFCFVFARRFSPTVSIEIFVAQK